MQSFTIHVLAFEGATTTGSVAEAIFGGYVPVAATSVLWFYFAYHEIKTAATGEGDPSAPPFMQSRLKLVVMFVRGDTIWVSTKPPPTHSCC